MNSEISFIVMFIVLFLVIKESSNPPIHRIDNQSDSLILVQMIADRERSMIQKDVQQALSHFSDDITWINSQGYYFAGKDEVTKFHYTMTRNKDLNYYYEAGQPLIRMLNSDHALVYYSWKMFWYSHDNPTDTLRREIGLMTLSAIKTKKTWEWVSVTNQNTPWFYDKIEPEYIPD